jgi:hypothetical protein
VGRTTPREKYRDLIDRDPRHNRPRLKTVAEAGEGTLVAGALALALGEFA